MSDDIYAISAEGIESVDAFELHDQYTSMLISLNQVIINIFAIINKNGSSFVFSESKKFTSKTELDINIFALQKICQDIDDMQDPENILHVELDALPIIKQANQKFSSQLSDLKSDWYVNLNETEALIEFESLWNGREIVQGFPDDVDIALVNSQNYQHKELLISYAKWQCFAPIADYLSKAMTYRITNNYARKTELNAEDEQDIVLIDNAISNCMSAFPIKSNLDKNIAQKLLAATEHIITYDFGKKATYLDGVQIDNSYPNNMLSVSEDFTAITKTIINDCNLTLDSKIDQKPNLPNINCILNWDADW